MFEYVRKVAEVAYIIANNMGKDTYGVNALMYSTMRGPDPKVRSSITQTAIRDGVAAYKTHKTKTIQGMKVVSILPAAHFQFKRGNVKLILHSYQVEL